MKSGGVKIVIENLMKAFKKHSKNPFCLIESGEQFKYSPPYNIKHCKIPELNYDSTMFDCYDSLKEKSHQLMLEIERYMDFTETCILHVHNANLFKNSYLPTALRMLAKARKNKLIILFQVHDFAEDRREELLKLMVGCIGDDQCTIAGNLAYPVLPNTVYLTINSRDKRLLEKIGIPKDRLFVFPNAVNTQAFIQKPIHDEHLLELISAYAKKNKYVFDKSRKNIVYPVKIIERKNVIEALLILKLLNSIKDEYQLLITLDASSPKDVKYSNMIKKYIKKNKLPVVIGFGFEVISPNENRVMKGKEIIQYTLADLFSHAQSILTTSILEGFGFAFIEGWLAGKQVVGREIDFVIEDFKNEGIKFPALYDEILVKGKDFARFSHSEQLNLLDSVNLKLLLKQSKVKKLIDKIKSPDTKAIENNRRLIAEKYSLKGYIQSLDNIILKAKSLSKQDIEVDVDNAWLINYFKKKN
jgi:hypothetical protein